MTVTTLSLTTMTVRTMMTTAMMIMKTMPTPPPPPTTTTTTVTTTTTMTMTTTTTTTTTTTKMTTHLHDFLPCSRQKFFNQFCSEKNNINNFLAGRVLMLVLVLAADKGFFVGWILNKGLLGKKETIKLKQAKLNPSL
jgi:hypothetical protein